MINQQNECLNRIFQGDASYMLRDLPSNSVHCIVISPPYYQQRDYATQTQIGNENSPEQYIQNLSLIFSECYRVLRDDGTLWLNLGDKYEAGNLGMPWRVAIALQNQGWKLRSDIIWHKPNAMPSSVKDRPTTDHEYIFFSTLSK